MKICRMPYWLLGYSSGTDGNYSSSSGPDIYSSTDYLGFTINDKEPVSKTDHVQFTEVEIK